jgi:hypothetical protein
MRARRVWRQTDMGTTTQSHRRRQSRHLRHGPLPPRLRPQEETIARDLLAQRVNRRSPRAARCQPEPIELDSDSYANCSCHQHGGARSVPVSTHPRFPGFFIIPSRRGRVHHAVNRQLGILKAQASCSACRRFNTAETIASRWHHSPAGQADIHGPVGDRGPP